jgi:hypothetical protein
MQGVLYGLLNLITIVIFGAIYGGGVFAIIYFAVRLALRHERDREKRLMQGREDGHADPDEGKQPPK